jgi:hypothetical protein
VEASCQTGTTTLKRNGCGGVLEVCCAAVFNAPGIPCARSNW